MAVTALPAAYQGQGWRPRSRTNAAEGAAGRPWRSFGVDSQFCRLRTAVVCLPDPSWPQPASWNEIQYLQPVDYAGMRQELQAYARTLEGLGVEVLRWTAPRTLADGRPPYNAVFARDLFTLTPEGAFLSRMASEVRAGEEQVVAAELARGGVPVIFAVSGQAVWEGADLLWLSPRRVLIGVGQRTSVSGAEQLKLAFGLQGIEVVTVAVPDGVQHLLGVVQILSADCALVRAELAGPQLVEVLRTAGFRVVPVPESRELRCEHALNVVTVDAMTVVMAAGCPVTRALLEAAGVTVAATVSAPNLFGAGGGLACATGILQRASA